MSTTLRTPHPTRRGGTSSAAESADGAEIFAAGESHGTLACEDRDNRPEVDGGDLRHSSPAGSCLAPTRSWLSESRESTEVRVAVSKGPRNPKTTCGEGGKTTMRFSIGRKGLWLGIAVVAFAACVVTGAFAVSGSDTITTIAGTGVQGFSGDGGPATSAKLYSPTGVAVDAQGNVYIADHSGARVRKVSPGGTISTFAGTGGAGFSGDSGLATSARVGTPYGVAVDGNGNVYISDRYNNRVRKVSPGGMITTFAGTGAYGTGSFGDGGPATSAQLRNPYGLAVDGKGNVYIADHDHSKVRKVDAGGTITTFAGTGVRGFSGDGGRATAAQLISPRGLAVDGRGNVYIADRDNNRVRKVSPGGTITTFAGTGESANDGDGDGGPATSARIQHPEGMVVDRTGERLHRCGQQCAQGQPRRDDHDVRRRRAVQSRRRRPGNVGGAAGARRGGPGRDWERLHRRSVGACAQGHGGHAGCRPDAHARRGAHTAAARPEEHHRHGQDAARPARSPPPAR